MSSPVLAFNPRPQDRRRFTEGDCWLLARNVWKRTGWDLRAFSWAKDGSPDMHAFVETPTGLFLDVMGLWRPQTFRAEWKASYVVPAAPSTLTEWGPPLSSWSYKRAGKIADDLVVWALKVHPELADE